MDNQRQHTQRQGIITHLDHDGSGVFLDEKNHSVHTYHTIPLETVTVTPYKRAGKEIRARLDHVDVPSPNRITARCPLAGTCGGCKWQHIDYSAQLALKTQLIQQTFKAKQLPCLITETQASRNVFFYRNRMDFVFGENGSLGLKTPDRWWETLNVPECFLLSPDSNTILDIARAWTKDTGAPFWNNRTYKGFFRYLIIREGKNTGERMVILLTSNQIPDGMKEKITEFAHQLDNLATSVIWGINPKITDISILEDLHPIKGNPWIMEEINGKRFKITPNAFFQTNSHMAGELQKTVEEFIGPTEGKTLLDLYCGSGFFSQYLHKTGMKTIGIELSDESIKCAKENAKTNGQDITYFVSEVEKFDWKGYAPDIVILDPPRAGLHPKAIKTILQALPKTIVYVSCNYKRLTEELPDLLKAYDIKAQRALDLFPHTPHVELVTLLTLK